MLISERNLKARFSDLPEQLTHIQISVFYDIYAE